ncbi:DUF3037 domain-containing protein [Rubrobacter indicoceani]|uniref:DUF3037 domain-containing protein n=1 Tax=Rubrobacter indicoceani TaxID=2051957 RepID=UPI00196900FD|nr:DUF3037 domain-containing protein [Rubrobacter indicoceani]
MTKLLYQYAVLRVVPRPERAESLNAGVALFCPERRFLGARVHLDKGLYLGLAPEPDFELLLCHLDSVVKVCEGGGAAGALGGLTQRERFGRVVAPKNTVIQPSVVHTGFTTAPEKELSLLFGRLVHREKTGL